MNILYRAVKLVGVVGVLVFLPTTLVPLEADASSAFLAGTCDVSLLATPGAYSNGATYVDFETTGGSCTTTLGPADPFLEGRLEDISELAPFTCTSAVGDGSAYFTLDFDGEVWNPGILTVVGGKMGDAATVNFAKFGGTSFFGTAELVQSPLSVEACLDPTAPFEWSGVFTWEDPVIE